VGEGAKKPVTELEFTTKEIPNHKMAGIIVLTDELIRLSSPSAEALVRRDLTEQIAQFRDEQFIRVAVTAGANNPASITNGVTAPNASGTTLAALYADLKTALASFDTAGITTEGLVIATTPAVARTLSMMVTSLGMPPQGFNVNPNGGTLLGYPVIVSASVDTATLVIFKPSEIFLADDGRVTLDASNQATLDMGSGNTDFNLWQRNCTAVRAEQWITWVKRREGAVAIIDTIAYVPGT
jgi:HK97 family phage major capsid protein